MNPASLRLLLLRRLAPAMLALIIAGAITAYNVALQSATRAYDRALLDTALAIAGEVRNIHGRPVLTLSNQAQTVLLTDKFDLQYFTVYFHGQVVAGSERVLPLPSHPDFSRQSGHDAWSYYDGQIDGREIRLASLDTLRDGLKLTVIAAETRVKRTRVIQEILLGMVLPELLLVGATLALVWFGIRSGLAPLELLRSELADRSQADLSPIQAAVIEEMQPVVQEINGLLRRLDHSLTIQRQFVSDAAHQLRTPISALQAQVELVLRESAPDRQTQLQSILRATQRLAHLVHQMLALARAEPSRMRPQQNLALPELLTQCAETLLPEAFRIGVDLGFSADPANVRGDPFLLQEMLLNLVDNALQHTQASGVVNVSCGVDPIGRPFLAIEDNGNGVAEIEREKIFERFYQSPGQAGKGCGLGLAIVRDIARLHQAEVSVDTSPELGGARFLVRFPPGKA
ncbi:MAG: two-component system, OmpR family, sensor histidine kinase [Pseudomonadota bacterium]|jgi:two-component system sensor histidine kinase TctE